MKWILMVPLIILAVFAGLCIILLLTPTSVRLKYINGVLNCRVRIYGIGFTVFPMKKRKPKKPPKSTQQKKPKSTKKVKKDKKLEDNTTVQTDILAEGNSQSANEHADGGDIGKKSKPEGKTMPDIDVGKILEYVKFGIASAKKMLKGVKVNYITVRCVIASDDAAKTAMLFGSVASTLSALIPVMEDTFNIKSKNISVDADFSETKSIIDADIKISTIAYKMVFSTIIILLKFKKMMKKAVQK